MILSGSAWQPGELPAAGVRLAIGVALVVVVHRFVRRVPWPRPFRLRFAAIHALAAFVAAVTWYAVSTPLEGFIAPGGSDLRGLDRFNQFVVIGVVFYLIVAGVSYAAENAARAARAESAAARTQLGALRAQLMPHFLFNALHTVVQLIPVDPRRAAEAAELVGDLLRSALEEKRDEVTLAEEWRFVSRYLELERIRFGDRLMVRSEIPDVSLDQCVPTFAVQTLMENAVHHGAAPRVSPTEIVITGSTTGSEMRLSIRNAANAPAPGSGGAGTGLDRLRERLAALYGSAARLETSRTAGEFEAVLILPVRSRA